MLALLREEEGVAGQVLLAMNVKLDDLRQQVMNLLGEPQTGTVSLLTRR